MNARRPADRQTITLLVTASALFAGCATSPAGTGPEAGPDPATVTTPARTTVTDEPGTRTGGGAAFGPGGTPVWSDPEADLRPPIELDAQLAEALEGLVDCPVDLIELRAVENPFVRESIERHLETLYDAA